ncbi:hypothetical protein [Tunicatimonas pelagia]|nr:hypothetical protein [Tunicatimonas pelagia]WKN45289.1 hypothetical protein P0M28_09995 [Tunicatimonas pelagia]
MVYLYQYFVLSVAGKELVPETAVVANEQSSPAVNGLSDKS